MERIFLQRKRHEVREQRIYGLVFGSSAFSWVTRDLIFIKRGADIVVMACLTYKLFPYRKILPGAGKMQGSQEHSGRDGRWEKGLVLTKRWRLLCSFVACFKALGTS